MFKELVEIVKDIMEENHRNDGLKIKEISIEFEEININIHQDECMEDVLYFAYILTQRYECVVHFVTDEDEIIVMLNERYMPDKGIKITIR